MTGTKNEKLKKLEKQVKELQSLLRSKEVQIQTALDTKSQKEIILEGQIQEEKRLVEAMNESISLEEEKIKELQAALTERESAAVEKKHMITDKNKIEEKLDLIEAVANVAISERERNLQSMLEKTKLDKEKALRVLVKIAGKGRIADFLAEHAGSPDLMDLLEEELIGPDQR